MFTTLCHTIFEQSINQYHQYDNVDHPVSNPYAEGSIEHLLYHKNWIDTVQWHLEDIIRDPNIDPAAALVIKRRIDASNQDRTDKVEYIDSYFLSLYGGVKPLCGATLNTETPAWAVDRLSILFLKIYHMRQEASRTDSTPEQQAACQQKLAVLESQLHDLSGAIEELLADIAQGRKYMKLYKQMKMYNDPLLNPVLYAKK